MICALLLVSMDILVRIGNNRYENEDGETSFFKRPPPKTTLMDFMTSLKISDDSESDKGKERNGNTKRRANQDFHPSQPTKSNTSSHTAYQTHYPLNNNHYAAGVYNDQIVFEQEDFEEPLDGEDEAGHSIYRERRNPLPPRFVFSRQRIPSVAFFHERVVRP